MLMLDGRRVDFPSWQERQKGAQGSRGLYSLPGHSPAVMAGRRAYFRATTTFFASGLREASNSRLLTGTRQLWPSGALIIRSEPRPSDTTNESCGMALCTPAAGSVRLL